jgi:hypothetical protein
MMCERMSAAAQFETLQGRFVEEVTRIERELSQSKASEVRVPLSLRCHLLLCVCCACCVSLCVALPPPPVTNLCRLSAPPSGCLSFPLPRRLRARPQRTLRRDS